MVLESPIPLLVHIDGRTAVGRMEGAEGRGSGQTNEQSSTDKLFADSIYVYTPLNVRTRREGKGPPSFLPPSHGHRDRHREEKERGGKRRKEGRIAAEQTIQRSAEVMVGGGGVVVDGHLLRWKETQFSPEGLLVGQTAAAAAVRRGRSVGH